MNQAYAHIGGLGNSIIGDSAGHWDGAMFIIVPLPI